MALIIVLQNITALAPISDYTYQVLVGDGTPERSKVLESGRLEGHRREDGWEVLVQGLLDAIAEAKVAVRAGTGVTADASRSRTAPGGSS